MHLVGEGVTRNFLTILEADTRRTARGLLQAITGAGLVILLAYWALERFPAYGFLLVPGIFALAFFGGVLWTRHAVLESYEVSLRDHWNRWMRWSVSCRTVRECYAKVHDQRPGTSVWFVGAFLSVLIVAHVILGLLALNAQAGLAETLPLFMLDAGLLGLTAGRRLVERAWYQRFLRSCNELLRDGSLGLWGVY